MEAVGAEPASLAGERDVVLEPAPRARQGCVAKPLVAATKVTLELALDKPHGHGVGCFALVEKRRQVLPNVLQERGALRPPRRRVARNLDGKLV
jgi:hypothetical protein